MRPISAEASRGYSHLTTGTSKGSFTPLLQLKKFPALPVSTREEAPGSRTHPGEPRFRLLARDEGSFPCFVGKEFPAFPSHLKRRRSPQERREELQGRATIPRVPQMFQGQPCAKASWESLMGKTRGKTIDPLLHAADCVTLLLPLWRKAQVHARIRDED